MSIYYAQKTDGSAKSDWKMGMIWIRNVTPEVVATLLCLIVAAAQTSPPARAQDDTDEEAQFWRDQFAGWDGIVFVCEINPVNTWSTNLCESVRQRARLLAAQSNIRFHIVEDPNSTQAGILIGAFNAEIFHPLELRLLIFGTREARAGAFANYVSLKAGAYYVDAIEKGAPQGVPEAQPKSGEFILWERALVSVGTRDASTRSNIHSNISTFLDEFFAKYLEARSSSNND